MGFGIGLGAFLEGAANGYAFGEGIKDKKRERERDDRLTEWAIEDRAQGKQENTEDRAWLNKGRGWAIEDRSRELAENAEDRKYLDEQRGWARDDRGYMTELQKLDLSGKQRDERTGMRKEADEQAERNMWRNAFSGQSLAGTLGEKQSSEQMGEKYADYYMKEKAPEIVQFYMQRGETEKAAAYQAFVQSQEVRRLTTAYGKAAHAAAIGNDQGFVDGIADAYDNIDDGVSINREKSKLVRDEEGNVTGGIVTFIGPDGKEFTQSYEGQRGIVQQALSHLSPHNTFEMLLNEQNAVAAAQGSQLDREHDINMEVLKARLKESGTGGITADDVLKEMGRIRTAESQSLNSMNDPMTEEQLLERAIANLKGARAGAASVGGTQVQGTEPAPYVRP